MKHQSVPKCLAAACAAIGFSLTTTLIAGEAPERGAASAEPAKHWEEAFVTGNGRMGAMLFGDPLNETFVANHCRLFQPLGVREIPADVAADFPEYRRLIREKGYGVAHNFIKARAVEQGSSKLVATDSFHPGFFVHVRQKPQGEIRNYLRTEDFRTGEVTVSWEDDRGEFRRRLFVSHPDNLIVFSLTVPAEGALDCVLEFPAPSVPNRKVWDPDWRPDVRKDMIVTDRKLTSELVTHHNTYALGKGSYDAGRYMFICCAGELPPNLQGIWTGSWNPAWSGDFTLDTNLQLAIQHAHSGNLAELMEGYFRLIEGFDPEWKLNARRTLSTRGGCEGVCGIEWSQSPCCHVGRLLPRGAANVRNKVVPSKASAKPGRRAGAGECLV